MDVSVFPECVASDSVKNQWSKSHTLATMRETENYSQLYQKNEILHGRFNHVVN